MIRFEMPVGGRTLRGEAGDGKVTLQSWPMELAFDETQWRHLAGAIDACLALSPKADRCTCGEPIDLELDTPQTVAYRNLRIVGCASCSLTGDPAKKRAR